MKSKKRSEKKKFNLKENYLKSWNYLWESKNFIYFAIGVFLVFALVGFFVSVPDEISEMILNYIQEILAQTEGLSAGGMIRFIFLNNFQSSFVGMFFGFLLGIIPLIALVANGFVVGFVSKISVESAGFISLLNLLPHGIFELPAIFISLGIGVKFGYSFVKEYFKKVNPRMRLLILLLFILLGSLLTSFLYSVSVELLGIILFLVFVFVFILVFSRKNLKKELLNGLRVFVFVVLPLLILAAVIEGLLIIFI